MEDALNINADGSVEPEILPAMWNSDEEEADNEKEKERLEALAKFEPLRDLFKRRFMWYYEHYMLTIEEHMPKHKEGAAFQKMPFESAGNTMDGKFAYSDLGRRLLRIKEVINEETNKWAVDGQDLVKRESTKASNFQRQFEQLSEVM